MDPAAPAGQQTVLTYFLRVGGIYPLVLIALALMLTLWGLINLAFVRNRFDLAAQAVLSFAPMGYAIVGLVAAWARFRVLLPAPGPGDAEKIADTVSLTFELSFLGSISTAIPAVVGIFALARNVREPARRTGKEGVTSD